MKKVLLIGIVGMLLFGEETFSQAKQVLPVIKQPDIPEGYGKY
jgi:hypothetical protein